MSRRPFIAGNWKMNTSKASAIELAKAIAAGAPEGVDVGIAPPFVYIDAVGQAIASSQRFAWGAGLLLREKRRVYRRDFASRCSRIWA